MTILYERVVVEDLNLGPGNAVTVTNPAASPPTLAGTKISSKAFGLPVVASDYDFAAQSPGGTLTGGVGASITLTPVPMGVNGADVGHYLYVSAGSGTPEAVLITGGTAVSDAASGTVQFTPVYSHSGAWTISSASAGIQEAISSLGASGGEVKIRAGTHTIYGPIRIGTVCAIRGAGMFASVLDAGSVAGNPFLLTGGKIGQALSGFELLCPNSYAGIKVVAATRFTLQDLYLANFYIGIELGDGVDADMALGTIRDIGMGSGTRTVHSDGILIKGFSGVIDNVAMEGDIASTGNAAIRFTASGGNRATDGCQITNLNCSKFVDGLRFDDGNYLAYLVYAQNSFIDCRDNALYINCSTTGQSLNYISLDNCFLQTHSVGHTATSRGFYITRAAGAISGLNISNCELINFYREAGYTTGNVYYATISGNRIRNAAQTDPTTIDALYFGNNLLYSTVIGNSVRTACRYSINYNGGVGSCAITGNVLSGFNTAALNPTGAADAVVIADNEGVDDVIGTVASGATITLPVNPTVKVTGTTALVTVNGGWTGRKVKLIFTDAAPGGLATGGNILLAQPAVQYSSFELVFDGTNWYPLNYGYLSGSATWDPGSLADGVGETSAAITVTGAALGDFVVVSAPYDLQGITCNGYVSAANTVKIRLQNETTGTIDLASGTWKVRVIK